MDKSEKQFLAKLIASGSINLPRVAREAGCDWDYIQPLLVKNGELRTRVLAYLSDLKYELLDSILVAARSGRQINAPAVRQVIGLIEDGSVLPSEAKGENSRGEVQELITRLLGPARTVTPAQIEASAVSRKD